MKSTRQARLKLNCSAELPIPDLAFIRKSVIAAHALLPSPLHEMNLAFVDDDRSEKLHLQFMNLPGPADVLTFPIDHDGDVCIDGDVVICVPEATRRAKSEKVPLKHELLLYALHGMMHLSGYDDRSARDYRKMHAKEDQILQQLGVGAVFAKRGRR